MKKTIVLTNLLFCALSVPSYAQSNTAHKNSDSIEIHTQQKRLLTPKDYNLWSKMDFTEISDNGEWYTYNLWYGNRIDRIDTLVVAATQKDSNYSFPFGTYSRFSSGSRWFGCLVPKKGMALLNLENDSLQWIPQISQFKFSADGQYLIGLEKPTDTPKRPSVLSIMNLELGKKESIVGVTEFLLSPTSNSLAYIMDTKGDKAIKLRTLESSPITTLIAKNAQHSYKKLVWNGQGTSLAFLQELPEGPEKEKRHKMYFYSGPRGRTKLKCLDPTADNSLFPGMDLSENHYIRLSDDGTVFFYVERPEGQEDTKNDSLANEVQVWGARDKQLYPKRKRLQGWKYHPKLAAWWPETDRKTLLASDSLPVTVLTGDRKHSLSYNPEASGPHFKHEGDIDLYLTDLETGRSRLFLEQQSSEQGHILVSPGGKYITYFMDQHWWIYDLEKKTHSNMTKELGVPVYDVEHDSPSIPPPYGVAGWTKGDKELLVYDQYDVWLFSPKGKIPIRLTKGRESQIHYRIDGNAHIEDYGNFWFPVFDRKAFNLSQGLMFKMLGRDMASGYSLWKPGKGLKELVHKDMYINRLKKARDKEAYIYREQSFDIPPRLRYWEPGMAEPKILMESNRQHSRFPWGQAELLRYPGPDGTSLQGALFYPANYRAGEKHPMIVHIYERQSHKLHEYNNPSQYLPDGWNPTNYTSEGYLVFYPDIKYTLNDPGMSAVICIEAGVQAVLAKGVADKDRIGLIGHSFGGYETTFVITQSDFFAAAVAGAAAVDLVSFYHTVGWDLGKDEMWRFEDHQWRFKDSFYKNPAAYIRNSPLHHAANIDTPLLLWTGEEDHWVDWHQSIELYMGLRRLDWDCELLIYPGEGHNLLKPKNQVDLNRRIQTWFAKYLKLEENGKGME